LRIEAACNLVMHFSGWNTRDPITFKRKKLEATPIICFRVKGSLSQIPETTFVLGPGVMHVEHHAASAPRSEAQVINVA